MQLKLQSNIIFIFGLLGFVVQIERISLVSCDSQEENEVDQDDGFIPPRLRDILSEEVAYYEISPEIQKKFVCYLSGFDFDNRPVWVAEVGHWDVAGMVLGGPEKLEEFDRFIRHSLYVGLNSTRIMSTEDEPVDTGVLIVDLDGFSLKRITSIPTVQYVLDQYQRFLPAFSKAHTIYIINTNYVGERFLNLIKPILGREYEKLEVYGTNKAKWIPALLRNIPRDQLAERYGGVKGFRPYEAYSYS